MIALRREEIGLLVMELSENLWPEDLDEFVRENNPGCRSSFRKSIMILGYPVNLETRF